MKTGAATDCEGSSKTHALTEKIAMIEYIIRDMVSVFRYLPYGLVVGILVAIILAAVNDRRVRRLKKPIPVAAVTSFFMYTAIILFITFLSRENGSRSGIDLQLFSTWGINARNNAYVVENVLLFIPYGFVCAWAIKEARKFSRCVLLGFFTSIAIECLQLVTGRGYFQIDDILTNGLGAILGYILFRCVLNEERTGAQRAKLVYIILAVLTMLAMVLGVFAFSSESSADSNEFSMRVAGYVVETVNRWLNVGLSAEQIKTVTVFMNPLLRKLAHASEYAALAVVFAFGYQMMKQKRSKVVNFFYAVIMCGLIAVMDELLQKYVFFRTGRALDIAIDLCGAIAGGCVYVFLSELFDFLAGSEE